MSTYTESQFTKATEIIGSLPKDGPVQPSNDDKLVFYGLFKQAKVGDNTTERPGMMNFEGKYKWDAWTKQKGLSTSEAQSKYVEHFIALLEKNGGEESEKHKAAVLAA